MDWRPILRGLAVAVVMAGAGPAAAAGELFGGLFAHDAELGIAYCCYEQGADLEFGFRTEPIASNRWGGLHVYGFGSLNTAGGVDFAAAGLAWRIPLGGRFYLQPGLGAAVQDGSALGYQARPDRLYLGSRALFEPELSLGYRLGGRWAVEASYVHLSHARLAGDQNPGLDDLGVRLVRRFGD